MPDNKSAAAQLRARIAAKRTRSDADLPSSAAAGAAGDNGSAAGSEPAAVKPEVKQEEEEEGAKAAAAGAVVEESPAKRLKGESGEPVPVVETPGADDGENVDGAEAGGATPAAGDEDEEEEGDEEEEEEVAEVAIEPLLQVLSAEEVEKNKQVRGSWVWAKWSAWDSTSREPGLPC